jgi:Spy/CpxP family protein refolding chaperone
MKNLILIGLFTGFAVTGVAFPSTAETVINPFPQQLAQRGPNPEREDRLMDSLNLNDQQKQDLNAIRQKYQGQMEKLYAQLRTRQDEMRTLMGSNASDNDIRAKHKQVEDLRQQLGELRFESMLASRKVLTPDQRKQFAQLMDERRVRKLDRNQGRPK